MAHLAVDVRCPAAPVLWAELEAVQVGRRGEHAVALLVGCCEECDVEKVEYAHRPGEWAVSEPESASLRNDVLQASGVWHLFG